LREPFLYVRAKQELAAELLEVQVARLIKNLTGE